MAAPHPSPHLFSLRKSNQSRLKLAIFLLPIVVALIFLGIKIWTPEIYELLVQEDTLIEYLQASFFFFASIFSFLIFKKFFKNRLAFHSILYGILFLSLAFITLEEVSWGQRIFNIENPEYFEENNMQEEISLHNLDKVNNLMSELYIMIGIYGTFGWLLVYALNLKQRIGFVNFYIPSWYMSSYFFFVLFTNALFSYVRPYAVNVLGIEELEIGNFFIYRDQEPAELLLSMGFLLFVAVNYFRLKKMESIKGAVPAKIFDVAAIIRSESEKPVITRDSSPDSDTTRRKEPQAKTTEKN